MLCLGTNKIDSPVKEQSCQHNCTSSNSFCWHKQVCVQHQGAGSCCRVGTAKQGPILSCTGQPCSSLWSSTVAGHSISAHLFCFWCLIQLPQKHTLGIGFLYLNSDATLTALHTQPQGSEIYISISVDLFFPVLKNNHFQSSCLLQKMMNCVSQVPVPLQ